MTDATAAEPTGGHTNFEDSSNEAAAVAQKPAGYGKRVLGAIIDFLLVMVAGIIPIVLLAFDVVLGGLGWLVLVVWAVWLFGYRQGVSGTTPGKRTAGTRLTGIGTGETPGGGVGVGRFLVPMLINIGGFGVYSIVDYLWPLWDDDNQRVSDKMFKTQVVLDDRPATPTQYNPIG